MNRTSYEEGMSNSQFFLDCLAKDIRTEFEPALRAVQSDFIKYYGEICYSNYLKFNLNLIKNLILTFDRSLKFVGTNKKSKIIFIC